jgi:hypothetical protein
MSSFREAIASGLGTIRDVAGQSVMFSDGVNSANITGATKTRGQSLVNQAMGVFTTLEQWDFLLDPSQIVLGGVTVKPVGGNQITTANGSVYEVMENSGEPAWRWSDSGKTQIRVHTKMVTDNG